MCEKMCPECVALLADKGPLGHMLAEHAVVLAGSKAAITMWDNDGLKLLSKHSFEVFYAHYYVTVEGKKIPLARKFMDQARRCKGLKLMPGKPEVHDGYFNMWRGFAIEPAPGDWSLMRAHIRDVIAAGDAALDQYIIKWTAWTVQNPGKPAEVALVLRGKKGSGKGVFGNTLCKIFGHHR